MARGSTLPAPRRGLRGAIAYRGGEGMLAWAFHRISGVAVWAFVILHVIDIYLVGGIPTPITNCCRSTQAPLGG